ncbi:MAG TPA: glycosyltransferase family 4 protein [Solirubrobacterales bacterium]
MSYGIDEYRALVARFAELVRSTVPENSTVIVVSKGDAELLSIDGRATWHFPRRADGTYAGYYPFDSASAISHLEELREKGGDHLAFPEPALWWLDHYEELRQHLESRYREISRDSETGVVYALEATNGNKKRDSAAAAPARPPQEKSPVEGLFLPEYYATQVGRGFRSLDEAVSHYAEAGQHQGADPHPLFDTSWYLARYPEVKSSGLDPLSHFVACSATEGQDPNPYFDTEYYYSQVPRLLEAEKNALLHYVDPETRSPHPNPLFRDGYYRENSRNARTAAPTPLEHYLRYGTAEGRAMSHVHEKLLAQVRGESSSLRRGGWTKGTVLWFTQGTGSGPSAAAIAAHLAEEHHIGSLLVSCVAPQLEPDLAVPSTTFVLEDYTLACEIFRPAALRLLAFALTASKPLFAVCDVPEAIETLTENGVPLLTPPQRRSAESAADGLLKLASKELGVKSYRPGRRRKKTRPKIVIPSSDWAVSGVNASLESIGLQLLELGWDLEVVFTRSEETVLESAADHPLPLLPYRFLERDRKGPAGAWHGLIGDLESQAPCILFMAYDFLANSVAPALSENVGIVSWVQADDNDYYEQVYRLGRYCNATICVSEVLRNRVREMNPVIGERAHVIHNSSVRLEDVARRRTGRADKLRLVYTGRLVQYQKRILEFVDLAQALDREKVPYEITLIGTFSAYDDTEAEFERLAAAHLEDGRIKLPGRMRRDEIMKTLTSQDVFVLLSDFEGLPLALVEAMARGCVPVTAASPSGIPEIIASEENGYIVEGRDYDEWAALLSRLWQDPEARARLSRNARRTISERFTVERIGGQFDELFRHVAKEINSGEYQRPPSLNWGGDRSHAGDVLPSPNLFRPASLQIPGLQ